MSKTFIYADHAATTALSPTAYASMQPWFQDKFGNPSTFYSLAREPRKAVSSARSIIAECIGAEPKEIYFTSGGTESDNWALTGSAFRQIDRCGHIITSNIEHHAILHTCEFLKHMGCTVDFLPVDGEGIASVRALEKCVRNDTLLVSVMLANNEIGTIEPIKELAEVAHQSGCLFHTDAVQAVGHIPVDVKELGVDMLSASAHKFNGPKGTGFLYIRDGIPIEPLLHGGVQENGQRAGTENVAGIVGMAAALQEHHAQLEHEMSYLCKLSQVLVKALRNKNLDFFVNGSAHRIPGSLSLSFRDADGEMLMHRLDLMGTVVATGSACDSKNAALSHVITSIGVPDSHAHGTIRVTLGMDNTINQMKDLAEQISRILSK